MSENLANQYAVKSYPLVNDCKSENPANKRSVWNTTCVHKRSGSISATAEVLVTHCLHINSLAGCSELFACCLHM